MNVRQCKKCHNVFDLSFFSITGKGYASHSCKTCISEYKKQWKTKNKKRVQKQCKQWSDKNKQRVKETNKKYHDNRQKDPQYIEKRSNNNKLWYKKNKKYIADKVKKLKHNNINFKIKSNLRTRLRNAIKNNWKRGSAINDLGCTIKELKKHLESKFQPGMTWDNYGKYGWHIDHVKPLSKFNLTDREEFLKVCHYSNLQPLWAKDNLRKRDKLSSL